MMPAARTGDSQHLPWFKGRMKGEPIDYIFVTDEFVVEEVYLDTSSSEGRYPSDHYPLVAVLGLKETAGDAAR